MRETGESREGIEDLIADGFCLVDADDHLAGGIITERMEAFNAARFIRYEGLDFRTIVNIRDVELTHFKRRFLTALCYFVVEGFGHRGDILEGLCLHLRMRRSRNDETRPRVTQNEPDSTRRDEVCVFTGTVRGDQIVEIRCRLVVFVLVRAAGICMTRESIHLFALPIVRLVFWVTEQHQLGRRWKGE